MNNVKRCLPIGLLFKGFSKAEDTGRPAVTHLCQGEIARWSSVVTTVTSGMLIAMTAPGSTTELAASTLMSGHIGLTGRGASAEPRSLSTRCVAARSGLAPDLAYFQPRAKMLNRTAKRACVGRGTSWLQTTGLPSSAQA